MQIDGYKEEGKNLSSDTSGNDEKDPPIIDRAQTCFPLCNSSKCSLKNVQSTKKPHSHTARD